MPKKGEVMIDDEVAQEIARQRQSFINLSMKKRIKEFTEGVDWKVFCGTWNVCDKVMSDGINASLQDWLIPSIKLPSDESTIADIYAVGFQEIVDLSLNNVIMDGTKSDDQAFYWSRQVEALLAKTGEPFVMLMKKHLVGVLLVIFIKAKLVPRISDLRGMSTGVGVMGVMGNKGGATIRFRVFDTSFCFVCSHLRAHREEVTGRNMDVKMILEKSILSPVPSNINSITAKSNNSASHNWSYEEFYKKVSITKHDYVFWMGDLNYRITKEVADEDIFTAMTKKELLIKLTASDQLNIERTVKGTVFNGFQEGTLNFLPTYKYIPNTTLFDRRPEKKIRAPAWCDRVLWKTKEPLELLYYNSTEILVSDHMPVGALFKIQTRVVDVNKELAIFKNQLAIADSMENDLAPKIEMRERIFDLGPLPIEAFPIRKKLIMMNVGKALASWEFMAPSDTNDINADPSPAQPQPAWCTFHPVNGVLLPGEGTEIQVVIDLNESTGVEVLKHAKKEFDYIAVIEVRNGSHFFCSITGSLAFDSFTTEDEMNNKSVPVTVSASGAQSRVNSGLFAPVALDAFDSTPTAVVVNGGSGVGNSSSARSHIGGRGIGGSSTTTSTKSSNDSSNNNNNTGVNNNTSGGGNAMNGDSTTELHDSNDTSHSSGSYSSIHSSNKGVGVGGHVHEMLATTRSRSASGTILFTNGIILPPQRDSTTAHSNNHSANHSANVSGRNSPRNSIHSGGRSRSSTASDVENAGFNNNSSGGGIMAGFGSLGILGSNSSRSRSQSNGSITQLSSSSTSSQSIFSHTHSSPLGPSAAVERLLAVSVIREVSESKSSTSSSEDNTPTSPVECSNSSSYYNTTDNNNNNNTIYANENTTPPFIQYKDNSL